MNVGDTVTVRVHDGRDCAATVVATYEGEPDVLDVYGLVATQVLGFKPDQIAVTACYLGGTGGPEYRSRTWDADEAAAGLARVDPRAVRASLLVAAA